MRKISEGVRFRYYIDQTKCSEHADPTRQWLCQVCSWFSTLFSHHAQTVSEHLVSGIETKSCPSFCIVIKSPKKLLRVKNFKLSEGLFSSTQVNITEKVSNFACQ